MKICFVSTYFQPVPVEVFGGIETQVQLMAGGLAEAGHDVTVLSVGSQPGRRAVERDGIEYRQLCLGTAFRPNARAVAMGIREFSRLIRAEIEALRPDLAHYHVRFPLFLNAEWHRRRTPELPLVYHAHVWKPGDRMAFPFLTRRRIAAEAGCWVDRRIAGYCRRVVAVSEFMRNRIAASAEVDPGHIVTVPNVIDTNVFKPSGAAPEEPLLLFIGRVAYEKGVLQLIEAMGRITEKIPRARLRIVGPATGGTEFGAYMEQCKTLVESLGLTRRVEFAGAKSHGELPGEIARAGVVAVPSLCDETFGLTALEGMACGRPVVASRAGGLAELITPGKTGLLVEPGNAESLANALKKVLNDEILAQRALVDGPALVREKYARASAAKGLSSLYRDLASDGAPAPATAFAPHNTTTEARR